jgi:hypothetical protein
MLFSISRILISMVIICTSIVVDDDAVGVIKL